MSWPLVKLGDVAPSKPIRSSKYCSDDIVWQITLDHIESNTGRLLEKNLKPFKEAGTSTHGFDCRYVLYSKLRPYLNKVLLPEEEGLCTTELVPMLPKDGKLDRTFLAHYLKSNKFVGWISAQTAGAKMPRVSMDVFWNHEIPLPPLSEQKRIAAILDKADAIRRKRQQAIKLTDDFLRSVFLEMFGDPVTNPKGWETDLLKNQILSANNGLSRRSALEENFGDIVLRLQDVHYDGIRYDKKLSRIQLDESEKKRYLLNEGDLLFIRVNGNPDYVGRSAVFSGYDESIYHNDHLIRLKLGKNYNSEFLSFSFNSKGGRKLISKYIKTSAGQHTISQDGIERIAFYIPPIHLQNKFVSIKNKVFNIPYDVEFSENLFASLSQKAFSGNL